MVTLYQFAPAFGLPNPSPFCLKIETYLRMIGEPYETKVANPRRAPKGKLPFIKDGTIVVSDSFHIIQHLIKTRGDKLDQGLSAENKALAHVIRRMLEEGTYFGLVYSRWVDDAGFEAAKNELFGSMPALARAIVPSIARGMVKKQTQAQGTGRHAPEDIYAMIADDLAALSVLLGEKSFFLGDSPTSIDATAYAFLALVLWAPKPPGLAGVIEKHPNLVAYGERMKNRFWANHAK